MVEKTNSPIETTPVTAVNGSLLLGIDLGTSRTRVISDSGAREMVRSVVGYPKDIIAIKLLGESVVVGDRPGEVTVICVQDPDWLGCSGALKLAQELPTEHWDPLSDIVAR